MAGSGNHAMPCKAHARLILNLALGLYIRGYQRR